MTRDQLEHAIRAACEVADDTELYIFGSQAILGTYPAAPHELRGSVEVDVQPKNKPEKVIDVDGALGELSAFHQTHGFYVHGISIDAAILPHGWESRTVPVSDAYNTRGHTGHCIEAHDLAASKLAAGRDKDRQFVTVMLLKKLVDPSRLVSRIRSLPVDSARIEPLCDWVKITAAEITSG